MPAYSHQFFPILRAGTFQDMRGKQWSFSPLELKSIAAYYGKTIWRAPLVLGHPESDKPVMGAVTALAEKDGVLFAAADLTPNMEGLIRRKHYNKVSAALFAPNSPRNPNPGRWGLRHVGMLGAAAPAVPGLGMLEFAAGRGEACFSATPLDLVELSEPEGAEFSAPPGYACDPQALKVLNRANRYRAACPGMGLIEAVRLAGKSLNL